MSAPLLCFIGGWGSTEAVWGPALDCAAVDAAPQFLSWAECIQDWPGALAKLHSMPQRCVLVGWSLGGLLALRVAMEIAEQKIAALVLVSATPRMCGTANADGEYIGADHRALAAMRTRIARTPDVVLEEFADACAEPDGLQDVRESWLRQARQFSAGQMAAGLECLATLDLRERLGEIRVPCRVLHGECDRIVPLGSAQSLAGRIPRAELEVLGGRGHALPFTAPAEIARCIAQVTKDVTKATGASARPLAGSGGTVLR